MQPIDAAERDNWGRKSDPAYLFIGWWDIAARWDPADRAILPRPSLMTQEKMRQAVKLDDGAEAVGELIGSIFSEWPSYESHDAYMFSAGLILEAMRAVDEVFVTLHPRTRILPPIYGSLPEVPAWVDRAYLHRAMHGSFAQTSRKRLIPNGPFARHARGRDASSANSLQDQFPFLSVAPREGRQEDRIITISMKVIGTDAMRGVPSSRSFGREKVEFIPLAEEKDDLTLTASKRAEQSVLDVIPSIDTAQRLLEVLNRAADVDLAFAPELTVPGASELGLAEGITSLASGSPRLILAGTGLTQQKADCGRSWNEARVYARGGHLLWKQRKIWPFGMQRDRALGYGLPDPGPNETLIEDIAGHSEISVVDMDGFGRCVILICQDFESRPLVDEIISRYQPDWILTPVLDPGVKISGWAHQRAVMLSKLSQSRIMVCSSLTLSCYSTSGGDEPAIGLAVGPAEPTEALAGGPEAPRRAVALVQALPGASPRSGFLIWDYSMGIWQQSTVSAE